MLVSCPHCNTGLDVSPDHSGQTVQCPACAGRLQVPTFDEQAAEASVQRAATRGRLEDMVDLMFMGSGGDESNPSEQQIHLQFKEEILDGLYVTLVKVDGGMRATFVVRDANSRRLIDGQVQNLVSRLSAKGITIVDTVIEVQKVDKGSPAQHGFDKDDHFDEL